MILKRLKKLLSRKKLFFRNYVNYKKYRKRFPTNKNFKAVLMGTPAYANLGDQLIAFAEMKFLGDFYGEENVLAISENDIRYNLKKVRKAINRDTIVFLQGGGNISDIWKDQENIRGEIMKQFGDNKKVLFPQTCFIVNNSKEGDILEKYINLDVVCAREKYTYDVMQLYRLSPFLCPDIALYLWENYKTYRENPKERNGIAICFRNDEESLYSDYGEIFSKKLKGKYRCEFFSTVKKDDVFLNEKDRENEIGKIIEYIRKKELIITDRLHAMIMAYLTDTPCIVLPNANKKIVGTYDWIKDAENIYLAKDMDDALIHLSMVIGKKNYQQFKYKHLYKELIESIG